MWFAIGFVLGIALTCLLIWIDMNFFIFSDLLFDLKYKFSRKEKEFVDRPLGKPISFEEWMKKNSGV